MPSRSAVMLSTALLAGGGGAAAALAIHPGGTTTKVVTSSASPPTMAASTRSGGLSVNEVYRRTKQGVVDITVRGQGGNAEGSGFVIDKKGHIATNQHVVAGAGSIEVKFADGSHASARVVGSDPSSDVAVIQVNVPAAKLQPLTFADSSKVQVGSGTIAIGSPYGLAGSVTVGVVSALGRDISAPSHYTISGAIQTDAPINHGNSGGPLLDANGTVIGMNSQIESNNGENTGVGFAVPSNTVSKVAGQIIGGGRVAHPFLGVSLSDGNGGALVGAVTSGSPASRAGIHQGDTVTAVDGHGVSSSSDLIGAVQAHKPGDWIVLTLRPAGGGGTHDVHVTLADRAS